MKVITGPMPQGQGRERRDRMIREGFLGEMTWNSGLNGERDPGVWRSGSRGLQAEGRACAKGWRWTLAGRVLGTEEVSAWLELREGGRSRGDAVRAAERGGLKVRNPAAGTQ